MNPSAEEENALPASEQKLVLWRPPLVGLVTVFIMLLAIGLSHALMVWLEHAVGGKENMYPISVALGFAGIIGFWYAVKSKSENFATWMGFLSALLIWICWVEFFYMYFGRQNFGMLPRMDGMTVTGTYPEYLIMHATVGVLLTMCAFYIFDKDTRCNMFVWFQVKLGLKEALGESTKTARDRNYGVITFMESFFVFWFCYAWNLIIFDPAFVGHASTTTAHIANGVTVFISITWGGFCMTKLLRYRRTSTALRYGIPVANILWINTEIASKYGMTDIWVHPDKYATELLVLLAAFVVMSILIYRSPKKKSEIGQAYY